MPTHRSTKTKVPRTARECTGTTRLVTPTTLPLLEHSRHESGFLGQWQWYGVEEQVAVALWMAIEVLELAKNTFTKTVAVPSGDKKKDAELKPAWSTRTTSRSTTTLRLWRILPPVSRSGSRYCQRIQGQSSKCSGRRIYAKRLS